MRENMERLAEVFATQMKRTSDSAVPVTLELGTIKEGGYLKIDSIGENIPKADYLVPLHLTMSDPEAETVPSPLRKLKPGDRVLVAWVGNDAVVVDVVVPGTMVK